MWRFKPFAHKEQSGLEGRIVEIDNYKVQIRNVIAEGGFSCVYMARDVMQASKQFALKHIICNDEESEELVMKEISVMKSLKGHPNAVTIYSHAIFDMGRTKEALILMEYCEKSLVNVLQSRGVGFFDEKQVLTIFRDVCNVVFAMHCQTPPIAHRDLKAENILLGPDGLWKLCDFGSISTNHKRFEKPEDMGIEEDNIRKHTTPAYRAPEMWDLFRRDLINEKVDIWALGCLLFRICYLKSAFDGESKLQILNGNYRIPDLPQYKTLITDLIRDMLQSSPDDRPDITQVWFRVNALLPDALQKSLPDRSPEMLHTRADVLAGLPKPANMSSPVPHRRPTETRNVTSASNYPKTGESSGQLGAFWSTLHAKEADGREDKTRPKYDDDSTNQNNSRNEIRLSASHLTPRKEQTVQDSNVQGRPVNRTRDYSNDLNLFQDDLGNTERLKQPKPEVTPTFQNDTFNAFIAEFNSSERRKPEKSTMLECEVEKLKEQLALMSAEKAGITSKYEKLSAICRSQRHEIQELKHALAASTPSPNTDSSRNLASQVNQTATTPLNEKIEGTIWELQQGFFGSSTCSDSQQWQPFSDDSKPHSTPTNNASKSVRTSSSQQNKQASSGASSWGFETDSFKVVSPATSNINNKPFGALNNSQRFGDTKSLERKVDSQPAGWAGF